MRTISATMANPAISYNADRTHLNSMSLHAVTSLIYFPSLMTTVIFRANTPKMNNSSRPLTLSANTSKGTEAYILIRSSSSIFITLEQRICYYCRILRCTVSICHPKHIQKVLAFAFRANRLSVCLRRFPPGSK